MDKKILVKTFFSGWHIVGEDITLEQAKKIIIHMIEGANAKIEKIIRLINRDFIKGATVEKLLKI